MHVKQVPNLPPTERDSRPHLRRRSMSTSTRSSPNIQHSVPMASWSLPAWLSGIFGPGSDAAASSPFRERIGEHVISPSSTPNLSTNEAFCRDLLHASIASSLAGCDDPQKRLDALEYPHRLAFAARAEVPGTTKLQPWVVCATAPDKKTSARTWFVAFRGTTDLNDVLVDATMFPVPTFGHLRGSVHLGFRNRAAMLEATCLREWLSPSRSDRVIFTGHSLGGAAAIIACNNARQLPEIDLTTLEAHGRLRCITFGAPAVADGLFAFDVVSRFHEFPIERQPFVQVVHPDDLVPKIMSTLFSLLSNSGSPGLSSISSLLKSIRSVGSMADLAAILGKEAVLGALTAAYHYVKDRAYVPCGVVVEIGRKPLGGGITLRWCTNDEVDHIMGPTDARDSVAVQKQIQSHLHSSTYHDVAKSLPCGLRLPNPPSAGPLLAPELDSSMCSVARNGSIYEVQLAGSNLLWLTGASFPAVMAEGELTPVQCFKLAVELSPSSSSAAATATSASTVDQWFAQLSVDTAHCDAFALEMRVVVHAVGVFGAVTWSATLPFSRVEDGLELTESESLTRRDGRFSDLAPCAIIDRAVLTLNMISRAHASQAASDRARADVEAALEGDRISAIDLGALLGELDDEPTERWLLNLAQCLEAMLDGGSSGVVLDMPPPILELLSKPDTSSAHTLDVRRAQALIDRLLRTGVDFADPRSVVCSSLAGFSGPRQHTASVMAVAARCSDDDLRTMLSTFDRTKGTFQRQDAVTDVAKKVTEAARAPHEYPPLVGLMVAEAMSVGGSPPANPISSTAVRALARSAFEDLSMFAKDTNGVSLMIVPASLAWLIGSFFTVIPETIMMLVWEENSEAKLVQTVKDAILTMPHASVSEFCEHLVRPVAATMTADRETSMRLSRRLLSLLEAGSTYGQRSKAQQALLQYRPGAHTLQRHRSVLEFLLHCLRVPAGSPHTQVPGDMYALECVVGRRLESLGAATTFDTPRLTPEVIDASMVMTGRTRDLLGPHVVSFHHCLRSALMVHKLRHLLTSTYVIILVGTRGAGKSAVAREVFGFDAVTGATEDDSTKDVTPFYLPVTGEGPIKRLLVLDVPGNDDELAVSSLFSDEGFAAADLILIVGRQERAVTRGTVKLVRDIIAPSGGLEMAVDGCQKVCSWGKLDESGVSPGERVESVKMLKLDRCLRPSVCKVAYLMTHADTQLVSVAQAAKASGWTGDMTAAAPDRARTLANEAWGAMRKALRIAGIDRDTGIDAVAAASCCVAPFPVEHEHVVATAMAEGAILDAKGVREFLAKIVPGDVAEVIGDRVPFRPSAAASRGVWG
jgi:hypothetical protein